MTPKNEKDLMFKLNQQFTSAKDLLIFYESNRYMFERESYKLFFSKLYSMSRTLGP